MRETGTHLGRNSSVRYVTRSMQMVPVLTNAGTAARKVTDLAGKNSHLLHQSIRDTGLSLGRGRTKGIESRPTLFPKKSRQSRHSRSLNDNRGSSIEETAPQRPQGSLNQQPRRNFLVL